MVQKRIVRFLEIYSNADHLFPSVLFLLACNNYYLTRDLATQRDNIRNYELFTWNIYLGPGLPSFPIASGFNYENRGGFRLWTPGHVIFWTCLFLN